MVFVIECWYNYRGGLGALYYMGGVACILFPCIVGGLYLYGWMLLALYIMGLGYRYAAFSFH